MERVVEIASLDELKVFALEFADDIRERVVRSGFTLGLQGMMGAGKTTFVTKLAECFGIVGQVSSPSYVLQFEYQGEDVQLDHWDIFRVVALPDELWEPPGPKILRIIEWSDKFSDDLDLDCLLNFEVPFPERDASQIRRVAVKFF
jgi:tRNA threonylcarbamoyl adenosine modification protein YjeE